MLAVGQTKDMAANYLDSSINAIVALSQCASAPRAAMAGAMKPTAFDALDREVRQPPSGGSGHHQGDHGDASPHSILLALSRKGAIGLMQLMPMTARELGVNPFVPEQNIEGGVRYFSQLLKMFGGIRARARGLQRRSRVRAALRAWAGGACTARRATTCAKCCRSSAHCADFIRGFATL